MEADGGKCIIKDLSLLRWANIFLLVDFVDCLRDLFVEDGVKSCFEISTHQTLHQLML